MAFEIDDLTGIGPYSMFPRTSAIESNQFVNLVGGPYQHKHYRPLLNVVFQNKTPTCQCRGVGHPIACALTEGLIDLVARNIDMDPLELRRRLSRTRSTMRWRRFPPMSGRNRSRRKKS